MPIMKMTPEGLNGRELADQLRKRKPSLKVIFSSGYSAESLGKDFSQGDTVFLSLPGQSIFTPTRSSGQNLPLRHAAELAAV